MEQEEHQSEVISLNVVKAPCRGGCWEAELAHSEAGKGPFLNQAESDI